MDYPVIYSSSKKSRGGIDLIVNYFEYVEWKTAKYNRLIAKFKPGHKVSELIDLKKLRELHRKFDLRETYTSSFYAWHRSSVLDVMKKIATINIRDHFRLLLLNKEIVNCLLVCISLPIELLKIITEYLPNKIISKLLVLKFIQNGKRVCRELNVGGQKSRSSHGESISSFGESSISCR
jgi:hypothetical protein